MTSSPDIHELPIPKLLSLYSQIVEELRGRGVTRSSNNPVADYAEHLCAKALSLERAPNSAKGFDATDARGARYQIKGRRVTRHNASRQVGVLRELNESPFEYLAGVLFHEDFRVWKACLVPVAEVRAHSQFIKRTNSWRFLLRDSVWQLPGATDITAKLVGAQRDGGV
jgi:hypothetical protein